MAIFTEKMKIYMEAKISRCIKRFSIVSHSLTYVTWN